MSQTSLSPNLVSLFDIFIPSEIVTLPEILFCLVEIIFLLLYRNYWAQSKNSRNKFLTQNWYKSELPSLIFTNFCLHYLHNALNKKTKKMIGHRVSFQTTDGQNLWNRTFWVQIFMKMLEKSYSIVTVYAHPYLRYCWARELYFIHMNYHKLFLKMCQNIKFNEYGNHCSQKQKTCRILFIIGRYNQNWYIFNEIQFLFNFSSDVR